MGQYCLKNINLSDAAQELDLLNLMGYDFAGPWTEISDHHAQLFTPYRDGSPHSKNLVSTGSNMSYHGVSQPTSWFGIPAYARSFQGATGPGQPFHGSGEVDYETLPPEWVEKAQIDHALGVAYYIDLQGKGFAACVV